MAQGSRRRGRIFIYLALILILGLVLVWVVFAGGLLKGFTQPQPTAEVAQETVDIVFTSQGVARGDYFTEAMLTTRPMPKDGITDGSFYTSSIDLIGKRAAIDMESGMPVTPSMAVDTTDTSRGAFMIPQGMVAISIPINKLSAVSYAPQEGDHVNIIASMLFVDIDANFQSRLPNNSAGVTAPMSPEMTIMITNGGPLGRAENENSLGQPVYLIPSESQRPRMVSHTLLQDAIILHVGKFPLEDAPAPDPAAEEGAPEEQAPVEVPDTMTIVVTPQDAVTLNYLVNSGAQLTLALRGAGDEQTVQTEAVTLQYLLDHYGIPVPAKLSVGMDPRVDQFINPLYDMSPR